MNPDVLLRILCHRADHAASKFLKKASGMCAGVIASLHVHPCRCMASQLVRIACRPLRRSASPQGPLRLLLEWVTLGKW